MLHMYAIATLDTLAALRDDEIVSSHVAPRVSVRSVAAYESSLDMLRGLGEDGDRIRSYDVGPITLRSPTFAGNDNSTVRPGKVSK